MSTSGKIADKTSYEELTDRQAAIVDAIVEDPDRIQEEIAERANELLEQQGVEDGVQRSYVSDVQRKYGHIIERRKGGDGGEGAGDPFQGQLDEPREWQSIKDRPFTASPGEDADPGPSPEQSPDVDRQTTADAPETNSVRVAMGQHGTVRVELDVSAVEEIVLNGSLPDSLRRQVFNAVVQQAFGGE